METSEQAQVFRQEGNAHRRDGRHTTAVERLENAIALDPANAAIWHDLALAYLAWNKPDAALAGFQEALRLAPQEPQLHFGLGTAFRKLGRPMDALQALQRAVQLFPEYGPAWMNLGGALAALGESDLAHEALGHAVELAPNDWEARWNLGLCELQRGDFRSGWSNFESRRQNPEFLPLPGKPWDGSPVDSLLVRFEQGLGDTLQFMRFLTLARERVGKLTFQVQHRLVPLLRGFLAAEELISDRDPAPDCEFSLPLMSLPHVLQAELKGDPYLTVDAARIARWASGRPERTTVAIAWQGNPAYAADSVRSIPLMAFLPVLREPDTQFISLQRGFGVEQIATLPPDVHLSEFGPDFDAEGAFLDSAAVLKNVDLLITSDTSLAHLAGALGVEVWLGLSRVPDWRWGRRGETSPWYSTLRMFRQRNHGDWNQVLQDMASELMLRRFRRERQTLA